MKKGLNISNSEGNLEIAVSKTLLNKEKGMDELASILVLLENPNFSLHVLDEIKKTLTEDQISDLLETYTLYKMTSNSFVSAGDWQVSVIPANSSSTESDNQ
jgi:hypothetical protein